MGSANDFSSLHQPARFLEVTLQFLETFFRGLVVLGPTLLFLGSVIALIGIWIGRLEKWTLIDSFYYAFITATTVGYGDIRPIHRRSKIGAIMIAVIGLVFTGIIVAVSLYALEFALRESDAPSITD